MADTSGSGTPDPAGTGDGQETAFEEGLIRAIAGGDADAFRTLLARHLDAVHAYLLRIGPGARHAEDLAQETFLRVWRRASTYEPGRVRVTTWLHTIAHNLCIDSFRRQRLPAAGTIDAEAMTAEADESSDPVDQASAAELTRTVEQSIAALPDNQRSALLLCQVQGFSNAQAAHILGVNVRALESLLARARRTLREALAAAHSGSAGGGDE